MDEYQLHSQRNCFDRGHQLEPTSKRRDQRKVAKTSSTSMRLHARRLANRTTGYDCWLRLLAASEVLTKERLDPLITEANELIAILTTIIKKSRD